MTYTPLDSRGRIARYPEHGRRFLRAHKAALAFFAEHPTGSVVLTRDGFPMTRAEYMAAHRDLLDKRINITGGLKIREPRDGEAVLMRDKRAIEDLLIRRTRGPRGLESRLAKKRLPEINQAMKESC